MESFESSAHKVRIMDGVVHLQAKPHVNVELPEVREALDAVEAIVEGEFGLLEDRLHDHSVSPMVYQDLNKRQRLRCHAIVAYREFTKKTIELEKGFAAKAPKTFASPEDASSWILEELKNR